MSIFEYDEEKHMQMLRSESYEDGRKETLSRMNFLIRKLAAENRYDDLIRSTADSKFQEKLLQEYDRKNG